MVIVKTKMIQGISLSAKDVSDGRLFYENARQITREDFEDTHKRTRLEAYDIWVAKTKLVTIWSH